ncbi:uncharacterized protein LOC144142513 isoform X2 [Haemaphysalis longicornis]
MRSEVMYRDLPGGPLVVKFADEVSLWCLCSKCGMFSKDMFQDSASHVFCSVCIFECSERKKIHCKHERRDVPVDDMVQAAVVGQVMSDQIVFCPNGMNDYGCKEFCALKDLESHYLKCAATEINCLSCGSSVKGADWEQHINTCPQKILQCRYCALAIPRKNLQTHEQQCYGNEEARLQRKNTTPVSDSRASSEDLPAQKQSKANWNTAADIGTAVVEAQPSCTNVESDDILDHCIHCKRPVKRKNIKRHTDICSQNKKRPTVSAVENIPGNAEDTPDSRKNTPTEGPYDPPREATTAQNSSLSCDPDWFAEGSRNTPTVAPSAPPREVTTLRNSSSLCGDPHWIAPDSRKTSIVGSNNPYREATALQSSFTSRDSHSMDDWTVLSGRTDPPSTETCTMASEISEMAEEALQSSLLQRGAELASAVTTLSRGSLKGALQVPLNGVRQLLGGISSLAGYFEGADHETSSREGDGASLHQQTTEQSSEWVWNYVFGSDSMKTETAEGSGVVPGITSSSSAANRLEGSSFLLSWPAQPCHRKISEWFDHFEAWLARNDITAEDKRFPLLLNKIPKRVSDALIYLQDNPEPYSAAKFTILHNF